MHSRRGQFFPKRTIAGATTPSTRGMDLISDCGQPSFPIVLGNPGCTVKGIRSCGLSASKLTTVETLLGTSVTFQEKKLVRLISQQIRRLLNRSSTNGLTHFSKGSRRKVVLLLCFRNLLVWPWRHLHPFHPQWRNNKKPSQRHIWMAQTVAWVNSKMKELVTRESVNGRQTHGLGPTECLSRRRGIGGLSSLGRKEFPPQAFLTAGSFVHTLCSTVHRVYR